MYYRGPGSLAVIYDSAPSPSSPVSKLSLFLSLPVYCQSSLLTGEGGGEGEGAKSYDGRKLGPLCNTKNILCNIKNMRYSGSS